MEKAARRYTTWVLGLHLLMLVALVVMVIFASNEIYSKARRQALDQVKVRQELLAAQSARGIEYFYRSVLNDLELHRRAVASGGRTGDLGPLMWEQLRGRAMRLFEVRGVDLDSVTAEYGDEDKTSARDILAKARPALLAMNGQAGITDTYDFNGVPAALAVMPIKSVERHMLVAVVPTRAMETRFLNDLN